MISAGDIESSLCDKQKAEPALHIRKGVMPMPDRGLPRSSQPKRGRPAHFSTGQAAD